MIKHTNITNYEVYYECDDCKRGEMVAVEKENHWHEEGTKHICNQCHVEKRLPKKYPYCDYSNDLDQQIKNIVEEYLNGEYAKDTIENIIEGFLRYHDLLK